MVLLWSFMPNPDDYKSQAVGGGEADRMCSNPMSH
jgi:hypothetical protein